MTTGKAMSAELPMMPGNTNKKDSFTPLILLALFFLLIFEVIAWDWWRHGPSAWLDLMILRHTGRALAAHPWVNETVRVAGILGKSWFLWTLVACGVIFLAGKKDWRGFSMLLFVVILGSWLVHPLQDWFGRPRPVPGLPGAAGFSFPSGSAFFAATVYGALAFLVASHLFKWWVKAVLFMVALAAALLVGMSRLGLRLHWFTDVLGAYALALSWLLLILLIYKKIQKKPRP